MLSLTLSPLCLRTLYRLHGSGDQGEERIRATSQQGESPLADVDRVQANHDIADMAMCGNVEEVKRCIGRGAGLHPSLESMRYAPLTAAAMEGQLEVVNYLLSIGANVNHKDGFGPALHRAVQYGHAEVAERLIAAGADPSILDGEGRTAYDPANLVRPQSIFLADRL